MRREVMESAGLEHFAEVGLIIFVIVFLGIIASLFLMKKDQVEHMEHLPLDDDINDRKARQDDGHLQPE